MRGGGGRRERRAVIKDSRTLWRDKRLCCDLDTSRRTDEVEWVCVCAGVKLSQSIRTHKGATKKLETFDAHLSSLPVHGCCFACGGDKETCNALLNLHLAALRWRWRWALLHVQLQWARAKPNCEHWINREGKIKCWDKKDKRIKREWKDRRLDGCLLYLQELSLSCGYSDHLWT